MTHCSAGGREIGGPLPLASGQHWVVGGQQQIKRSFQPEMALPAKVTGCNLCWVSAVTQTQYLLRQLRAKCCSVTATRGDDVLLRAGGMAAGPKRVTTGQRGFCQITPRIRQCVPVGHLLLRLFPFSFRARAVKCRTSKGRPVWRNLPLPVVTSTKCSN